jgi:hemoglobin-like flavoprotein
MGARHVAYGAEPEHYPVVGEVLIGAMTGVGGRFWRKSYTEAWTEAFGAVAGVMIEGAESKRLVTA